MLERHRVKQTVALQDRPGVQAIHLRAEAGRLPQGPERADLLRLACQAETAGDMCEWLKPSGSQSPK
jgi:hypothetical protein